MLRCQVFHVTLGSASQAIHFFLCPCGGVIPADGMDNIAQCENLSFWNEQPGIPMRPRVVAKTVWCVDQGKSPDIEVEPETGLPTPCPPPDRLSGKTADDFRGLARVIEAFSLAVEDRNEFGHPERQAEIQRESNFFVAEPDRGFQAADPRIQADGFPE
jgi:hypothetical protein